MHKLITIITLTICMYSCKEIDYEPKDCDLIFEIAEKTSFAKAITDATAQHEEIKFDHVAMIFIENGEAQVIEASAKKGVAIIPLKSFISQLPAGYIIKRVRTDFSTIEVIERAKTHLGEPYDWSFLPNNGKMYCSELIYESFINLNGNYIFKSRPMNFRDSDGNMPQFWIDLFNKSGEKIPEGVEGTNPNDLFKEGILEEVCRSIISH